MTKGYIGKILDVDLSAGQARTVEIEKEVMQNFLGGLGLGMKIFYDEVKPGVDPLSPENVLIVAPGRLSGTTAPTNGRTEVITKSPLTGILGRGNFGGWWGPRLKHAGFEAVVVRGKADSPVVIWINDDQVELKDAENLWGKDTFETADALKSELGDDISVLSIGQAGENQVKFACPVADCYHAPGRSHAGCVMGYKKLKAIAVRGTQDIPVAKPDLFKAAINEAVKRISSHPDRSEMPTGGNHLVRGAAKAEILPGKNFQSGILDPDSEIWDLPESAEKHLKIEEGYYGYHCPYSKYKGCNLMAEVKEGPYAGLRMGGVCYSYPGWEWGAKLGIKSYPAMWKCRELSNRYGMDQATSIPFAMELFQKGIITTDDTGGLELTWGNESAIIQLIGQIARREGFGDILADGSVRAAKRIGGEAEKYPLAIKGLEVFVTNPRTAPPGASLGYLANIRGGDDLDCTHAAYDERVPTWAREAGWDEEKYLKWFVDWIDMPPELKREFFGDPPTVEFYNLDNLKGRSAWVKWCGDCASIYNSLGLCLLAINYSRMLGPTHFAKLYSAFSGQDLDVPGIMKVGERIFNLMKAYIVREGLSRKDDDWPERFYNEPWPSGPLKGRVASKEHTKRLLDEYYELRGWDVNKGVPTKQKLIELGLDYVADELVKLDLIEDGP